MPEQLLDPTPLHEVVGRLGELVTEDRFVSRTLYVQAPLALATPDCPVVAYELDEEDIEQEEEFVPEGYDYLLEVEIAEEAASVAEDWREEAGTSGVGAREAAAAIIYYATFDAYAPIGKDHRPMGGKAQWGSSATAAADANLQSAAELTLRHPGRSVATLEEQWAVQIGDLVQLRVWFAGDDGPRPEVRTVRIESVEGDFLTATAVGADVHLELRHDHIVGIGPGEDVGPERGGALRRLLRGRRSGPN